MSDFKFSCPHCAQRLRCDERHSGRRIQCPKCGRPITMLVPASQPFHPAIIEADTGKTLAPFETPPASLRDSTDGAK